MSKPPLQICLIAGSAEYPSQILACLEFLAEHIQALGGETYVWDLAQKPLPLLDLRLRPDPDYQSELATASQLTSLADLADAFVWGSPVYHNSFSGILKNALDNLVIQQCCHKPVALVSCGNSDRSGSQPCEHLRCVARGLHAVPIPTQMVTLPSDFTRVQEGYLLTNAILQERAVGMAEELFRYASALRSMCISSIESPDSSLEKHYQLAGH